MTNKTIERRSLFAPLTYYWFDQIASGKKRHEYRRTDSPKYALLWRNVRGEKGGYTHITFQRGFQKPIRRMTFAIKSVSIVDGTNSDLKINIDVFKIELGERVTELVKNQIFQREKNDEKRGEKNERF